MLVETCVSSWLKSVEGDADEQKHVEKGLGDDANERREFEHSALDSILDSSRTKFACPLQQWTWRSMANVTIVNDSTFDKFTHGGLFQMVIGKPNVAVVEFTNEGASLVDSSVLLWNNNASCTSATRTRSSFHMPHGRCMTTQRLGVKEGVKGHDSVTFNKNNSDGFSCLLVVQPSSSLRTRSRTRAEANCPKALRELRT